MVSLNSKELKQAKQYIKEGKFDDAIRILDSFEESGGLTLYETVSCHLIRCDLYLNQRSYRNGVKLAEKTYKQSLDLGNNLVTVDTLLILAHSLIWLENPKKALERLKQAEKLLSSLKEQQPSDCIKRESRIAFLRGMAYNPWFSERGDLDLALKYQEQSIEIQESHGRKPHPYSFLQIAWILSANKGELNRALTFAKKGLKTAEESGKMPAIAWGYHLVGIIYSMKGDADQSINFLEKNLEISQKLKDKQQMAYVLGNLGEIYAMKGAFDRALEFLNESMELNKELNRKRDITFGYQQLINILIQKGDIEKAKENLNYMERITNQLNDNTLNIWYLLCKALILKTSPRARSRGKAEEILVQALKEEIDDYQLRINVLLELAELLIIELRLTNDLGVLQELESYIAQLLEITQKSHSFLVLGEIYILQAKLALINFDLKKARILLTKGQQISESFGLNFLAQKISNEHDKLLKQLEDWENLKESNASIAERIEMSHMNEQMNSMVQKRIAVPQEIKNEEPVVILIISKAGNPIFSQSFAEGWSFQDHLFGGFLSAINSFSDEIFSQGLDRAIFGEYTIIMNAISSFIICYLFKGQSFLAQQRMKHFIGSLQNDKMIWETINRYYQTNQLIQAKDIPSLDLLIKEIFVEQ